MPSLRHQALAVLVPRVRRSRELDTLEAERARLTRWQEDLDHELPVRGVRGFSRRFEVATERLGEGATAFDAWTITRRGRRPARTVLYLHGGGYVAPADPQHVRYACRLADELDVAVVVPDYPLTPTHTWRDSHDALVDLATRLAEAGPLVLAGDSAGGGLALAVAVALRERGGPQAEQLLLVSPWVDLTPARPVVAWFAARDPWLFPGKLEAYAGWWAGSDGDRSRPEVSPALADLAGLPPALVLCGTRDLLVPGVRAMVRRGGEAGWDVTYVEEPGLIHVYPLLPGVPEAARAWRTTVDFLRR